jgi:hypothetical protein
MRRKLNYLISRCASTEGAKAKIALIHNRRAICRNTKRNGYSDKVFREMIDKRILVSNERK